MSKPKKPDSLPLVQPSMHFEGDREHVLSALLTNDEAPILKSVGCVFLPNLKTQSSYVSYVITSQGDKILKIEVEEPNMKYIAEESAKLAFVQNFMSGDN